LDHALSQTGMEALHGVPLPDVVVDRAGWLLRAGMAALPEIDVPIPPHAMDAMLAMDLAEAVLLEGFDEAGPSARAGAVRNLIETSASANALDDAIRFALSALAPQRFRALPLDERAHALATLARSISDSAYQSSLDLDELPAGDDRNEQDAEFQELLGSGLDEMIPRMLDEVRRLSPIPSDAARLLVTSLISAHDRAMPALDTQRAMLDLFETQMPYLQGADRDATLGRLAASLEVFDRPDLQWRVLNMVEHRLPGAASAADRLAHVGTDGRSPILLGIVNFLSVVEDEHLRRESLSLLADQLAPERARALPMYPLQQLLVRMVEFDPGAHGAERMLTIALDALDALQDVHLLGPLEAMARREAQPLGQALAERMREARLRLIPRLPLESMRDATPLLNALSPEDEARVLAARTNEANDAGPSVRQAMLAMVARRLDARVESAADESQVIRRMADALSPDAAAAWAHRLEADLVDVLNLRLNDGQSIEYGPLLAMLRALREQSR
jgi:hypothetical protein